MKKSIFLILFLLFSVSAKADLWRPNMIPDCQGMWLFTEGNGSFVSDKMNNFPIQLQGGVWQQSRYGVEWQPNDSTDYGLVNNSFQPRTGGITVVCWYYVPYGFSGDANGFAGSYHAPTGWWLMVSKNGSNLEWDLRPGENSDISDARIPSKFINGTYHMIAGTRPDVSGINKVYFDDDLVINGVARGANDINSDYSLYVPSVNYNNGLAYQCGVRIKMTAIWYRELSYQELMMLYAYGKGRLSND